MFCIKRFGACLFLIVGLAGVLLSAGCSVNQLGCMSGDYQYCVAKEYDDIEKEERALNEKLYKEKIKARKSRLASSMEHFKSAAESGSQHAQLVMGNMHYSVDNFDDAEYWYKKAAENNESQEGRLSAHRKLAELFRNYHNRDNERLIYWYEKAAKQGDLISQSKLRKIYLDTSRSDSVKSTFDYARAKYWYEVAAKEGDIHAKIWLAYQDFQDHNTMKKITKGLASFKKLADQGYPEAQIILGNMHRFGRKFSTRENTDEPYVDTTVVKMDLSKAIYWYKKAANQENPEGQYSLAETYMEIGSETKALYWFTKLAQNNHKSAQNQLGMLYYRGKTIKQDIPKSLYWFKKAGHKGEGNYRYVRKAHPNVIPAP